MKAAMLSSMSLLWVEEPTSSPLASNSSLITSLRSLMGRPRTTTSDPSSMIPWAMARAMRSVEPHIVS